jgi:hypothetical protein
MFITEEEFALAKSAARLKAIRQETPDLQGTDHGYLKYIDHLGDDEEIVRAARMSTQRGSWGGTGKKMVSMRTGSRTRKDSPGTSAS